MRPDDILSYSFVGERWAPHALNARTIFVSLNILIQIIGFVRFIFLTTRLTVSIITAITPTKQMNNFIINYDAYHVNNYHTFTSVSSD